MFHEFSLLDATVSGSRPNISLFYATCVMLFLESTEIYRRIRFFENVPQQSRHCLFKTFKQRHIVKMTPQPLQSPVWSFLFPIMNSTMKEQHVTTIEDGKQKLLSDRKAIPQTAFENYFEDWKKCWHNHVLSNWDCLKGTFKRWWIEE